MKDATTGAVPTYEQRKRKCPSRGCGGIMILTPDEYAAGIYVCPYCGYTNDPQIRSATQSPSDCLVVPRGGSQSCTRCGRRLVNVVWVDGAPYGSTCCHRPVDRRGEGTMWAYLTGKRFEALKKRLKALLRPTESLEQLGIHVHGGLVSGGSDGLITIRLKDIQRVKCKRPGLFGNKVRLFAHGTFGKVMLAGTEASDQSLKLYIDAQDELEQLLVKKKSKTTSK